MLYLKIELLHIQNDQTQKLKAVPTIIKTTYCTFAQKYILYQQLSKEQKSWLFFPKIIIVRPAVEVVLK